MRPFAWWWRRKLSCSKCSELTLKVCYTSLIANSFQNSNSICFKVVYSYLIVLCICTPKIECVEFMLSWSLHACVISLIPCSYYLTYNMFISSFTHWDGTKAFNMFKMGILPLDNKNSFAALATGKTQATKQYPHNYTCENLSRKSEHNGIYGIKNGWICRRVVWLVYNGSLVLIKLVNAFFASILIIAVNLNVKWENKSCSNIN